MYKVLKLSIDNCCLTISCNRYRPEEKRCFKFSRMTFGNLFVIALTVCLPPFPACGLAEKLLCSP